MTPQPEDTILEQTIKLAEAWQNRANELLTSEEKTIHAQMKRLLLNPVDKVIMAKMIDQSFRSADPYRVADQIDYLFSKYSVPDFFSVKDKILMRLFLGVGKHFPHVSVPRFIGKMRDDSSRSIIPGESEALTSYLRHRKSEAVGININHLGEAVLGEQEAMSRVNTYLEDLADPEIECISVKISTIFSQIQPLAFDHTIGILKKRLSMLYRSAMTHYFVREDGSKLPKMVNLDMEEYRDVEITLALFMQTLDQPEFNHYSAGIVLQAYLPDSYALQKQLTDWAKKRTSQGKSPIKLRIVKGANMEMERVESAIRNWPAAPYDSKLDVDANYRRMVDFGMAPENIKAVNLGIASHNLFELAYAHVLARLNNVTPYFMFEMLEGMADHVRRAICEMSGLMLLYAPVATKDQFINAIAYLIRRLDENTSEENFLRYACDLTTDSREWGFLKQQFIESFHHRDQAKTEPNRNQDRSRKAPQIKTGTYYMQGEFQNEPDTDWALAANRYWAEDIRRKWKMGPGSRPVKIPLVVAGKEIYTDRDIRECFDPSQIDEDPHSKICVARYSLATNTDALNAVAAAIEDPDGWRKKTPRQRHRILSNVAAELHRSRHDLIGAAVANTGKVFGEVDAEVSEAVDFTEYYPHSVQYVTDMKGIKHRGKGVGLVISPWNFPIAIPCGGIAASLATGNTVIFKPSSYAVLAAWQLCQCFWNAGISKNILQFIPCRGSTTGAMLTCQPDVDFIILTGGTETGMNILKARPDAFLVAETGGKNATIVTAMSDRDLAIKDVIHSAFGNGGQKCSATSLLILEKEVYEDKKFKKQLVDAARSFSVGSAWEFQNRTGALIIPPQGVLKQALTRLEPGETWALESENIHGNPHMWTPGIKWDVQPGNFTHMTEFFGPVLGVMRAEDLDHGVDLVNQTGFGLTSGLESLDPREHTRWRSRICAGNLYINRETTGALVLRQPFGGMGKSALGAGIKVGGPNYVIQFMAYEESGPPSVGPIQKDHPLLQLAQQWKQKLNWGQLREFQGDLSNTIRAIKSYLYLAEQEFSQEKDYFHIRGQDNMVRYLPVGKVVVRIHEGDSLFAVLARIAAVRISGCELVISRPPDLDNRVLSFLSSRDISTILDHKRIEPQTDAELIKMIPKIRRIRYASPESVPTAVSEAAAAAGFYIARSTVLMEGRIELLQYFQEQSISNNYHRYGNLGERGLPSAVETATSFSTTLTRPKDNLL